MKKIYKISHCHTDVHVDDYQHGEGEFVNQWSLREVCAPVELEDFDSLNQLLSKVNEGQRTLSLRGQGQAQGFLVHLRRPGPQERNPFRL